MSTWSHYHKTSVKPLTLHAKDELFLGRGCKAQRIQFHRRGIVTAGCFSSDPHKSEFIESHHEIFHENIYIFWVLLTNFDLASQRQKLTAISDHTYLFAGTGLVLYRRISNEPSLNITAIELLENSYIQLLSNGPALKFRTCRIRPTDDSRKRFCFESCRQVLFSRPNDRNCVRSAIMYSISFVPTQESFAESQMSRL